jgi:hypothetical protein
MTINRGAWEYYTDGRHQEYERVGCDIHIILEAKNDEGRWVGMYHYNGISAEALGIDGSDKQGRYAYWKILNRDYDLFASLAGVRGNGPKPRGLPPDASELSRMTVDSWAGDGHSHSWGLLSEIGGKFLARVNPAAMIAEDRYEQVAQLFNLGRRSLDDYRIVFFFDN